jgi:hypothetical protein
MKIERILCGMQTADGKIITKYSSGIIDLLQPKSRDKIKALKVEDSKNPLWFPTEKVLAYPVIIKVVAKDPSQGGRDWVQNQTFIVKPLELFAYLLNNGANPFNGLVMPELDKFPESFDSITI